MVQKSHLKSYVRLGGKTVGTIKILFRQISGKIILKRDHGPTIFREFFSEIEKYRQTFLQVKQDPKAGP